MIRQLYLALITVLILAFDHGSGHARAAEPTEQHPQVESEFASLEDARAVEKQLRALSDKLAPAVVKLSGGDADETLHQGGGVVIHPSGLILTHGHHGLRKNAIMKATFSDGQVVDAVVESVFSGRWRDFSLLKIQKAGQYPAVPLRREKPPVAGTRCFHFGFPGKLTPVTPLSTPLLRLGRIAGVGQSCTYANCLITSGDSGGPLFDFEGRLIGILDLSIGPYLRHPGVWADISRILDGATFLTNEDKQEAVRLGFTNGKRKAVDTKRHLANKLFPELITPARRATVEVLVDGRFTILGTIVDKNGLVLTKRSEIMTHRGTLIGKLTCRLFDGKEVSAKAVGDFHEDDVAFLQLPKGGFTSAPFSQQAEPRRGVIVVVPIPGKDVSETGVVSVDRPFKIEPHPGKVTLAVEMQEAGVTVKSTVRDLEREGLAKLIRGSIEEGDVITHVDGDATPDLASYHRQTKKDTFISGDFIQFSVHRDRVTSQVTMPIESENPGYSITIHGYADVSLRLTGFPAVIIHDTIVARQQCGGPVVDLEGRVVGVNIARFHRCSTFAIPPQRIQHLVHKVLNKSQRKN